MKREEIRIRDPYFLKLGTVYYLYGTTDENPWEGRGVGFQCYMTRDLLEYTGPFPVFRPAPDFWATENFWAPEVVAYQGKFYMTASFKADGVCRGVQVLVSESPLGPFFPVVNHAITPSDWECLDGTLFWENGAPYLIFSHEWTQVGDGEICTVRLDYKLLEAVAKPQVLFRASEADWCVLHEEFGHSGYVTDGPFLRKCGTKLEMIWSSFSQNGYAVGKASADSLLGVWRQEGILLDHDGGHGMIFTDPQGKALLTCHAPNIYGLERVAFYELEKL